MRTRNVTLAALCAAGIALAAQAVPAPSVVNAAKTEEVSCGCPQDLIFLGGFTPDSGMKEPHTFYWWADQNFKNSPNQSVEHFVSTRLDLNGRQAELLAKVRDVNVKQRQHAVLIIGHSYGAVLAQNIADELSYLVDKNTKRPCVETLPVDGPIFHKLTGEYGMPEAMRFILSKMQMTGLNLMAKADESMSKNEPDSLNWTDGFFGYKNTSGIHSPWDEGWLDNKDPRIAARAAKQIADLKKEISFRQDRRCEPVFAAIVTDKKSVKVGEEINVVWGSHGASVCESMNRYFSTKDKPQGDTYVKAQYSHDKKNVFSLICYRYDKFNTGRDTSIATTSVEVYDDAPTPTPTAAPTATPTSTAIPSYSPAL